MFGENLIHSSQAPHPPRLARPTPSEVNTFVSPAMVPSFTVGKHDIPDSRACSGEGSRQNPTQRRRVNSIVQHISELKEYPTVIGAFLSSKSLPLSLAGTLLGSPAWGVTKRSYTEPVLRPSCCYSVHFQRLCGGHLYSTTAELGDHAAIRTRWPW